jgi:LEA14-like dessication related protein
MEGKIEIFEVPDDKKIALKNKVVLKIDGVAYSESVPQSVAIKFIAKNFSRNILFEDIGSLSEAIKSYLTKFDIAILDNNNSNDTDIFVSGLDYKIPINNAVDILIANCGVKLTKPYSKVLIQNKISMLEISLLEKFRELVQNWHNGK